MPLGHLSLLNQLGSAAETIALVLCGKFQLIKPDALFIAQGAASELAAGTCIAATRL